MQFRYKINEQSYVLVIDDNNGVFIGKHFKNGCSRNLMEKQTTSLAEMEEWIVKMRQLFENEQ